MWVPGVGRRLVEADARDRAGEVGLELDAELDRVERRRASTVAGAAKSKIVACGVTALEAADAGPVPTAFVAVTLNV